MKTHSKMLTTGCQRHFINFWIKTNFFHVSLRICSLPVRNVKQKKAFQVLMIAKKNILTLVSIKIGQCFHTNGKNMNKHPNFFLCDFNSSWWTNFFSYPIETVKRENNFFLIEKMRKIGHFLKCLIKLCPWELVDLLGIRFYSVLLADISESMIC